MGTGAAYYNILYCQRPCNNASSWMNGTGRFDQTIDANENEVWGVNDRGQIYKRAIDGSNKWLRINQHIQGAESTSFLMCQWQTMSTSGPYLVRMLIYCVEIK